MPSSGTLVPYLRSMFHAARAPALTHRGRYAPNKFRSPRPPSRPGCSVGRFCGVMLLRPWRRLRSSCPPEVGNSPHLRQRHSTIRRQAIYSWPPSAGPDQAGLIVYFDRPWSIEFFSNASRIRIGGWRWRRGLTMAARLQAEHAVLRAIRVQLAARACSALALVPALRIG